MKARAQRGAGKIDLAIHAVAEIYHLTDRSLPAAAIAAIDWFNFDVFGPDADNNIFLAKASLTDEA